jgi:hypothetical protein
MSAGEQIEILRASLQRHLPDVTRLGTRALMEANARVIYDDTASLSAYVEALEELRKAVEDLLAEDIDYTGHTVELDRLYQAWAIVEEIRDRK